jgi:hypothetical protein
MLGQLRDSPVVSIIWSPRFGLLLRELGFKSGLAPVFSAHYSSIIGVALTLLGVAIMIVALVNFMQIRRAIFKTVYKKLSNLHRSLKDSEESGENSADDSA